MLYALDGGSEGKFICEVHVIQQVLYPVGDNKTSNRMMLILLNLASFLSSAKR